MDRVARNRPNPTAPGICGSLEKSRRPEPVKVPPAVHARRGLRRFTIGVSEDDLRVIAEHGNEGAASAPEWACDAQSPRTSVAVEDGEGAPPPLADTPPLFKSVGSEEQSE